MTQQEAIHTLAALVSRMALRCWPHLGTDEAKEISGIADDVFKAMLPDPIKTTDKLAGGGA